MVTGPPNVNVNESVYGMMLCIHKKELFQMI